jgi:hypothetical protein
MMMRYQNWIECWICYFVGHVCFMLLDVLLCRVAYFEGSLAGKGSQNRHIFLKMFSGEPTNIMSTWHIYSLVNR